MSKVWLAGVLALALAALLMPRSPADDTSKKEAKSHTAALAMKLVNVCARDKDGDEGFETLLKRIRAAWRDNRKELEQDAANLSTAARKLAAAEAGLMRRGPIRPDLAKALDLAETAFGELPRIAFRRHAGNHLVAEAADQAGALEGRHGAAQLIDGGCGVCHGGGLLGRDDADVRRRA